jgi:mRNA interferase MazF
MVIKVDLNPTVGHEIRKARPCVVIQNDIGNANSHLTIVAPIEGAENRPKLYPVNVLVKSGEGGLAKDSVVLCEQVRTIDERRFLETWGKFNEETMRKIDESLRISLAL